MQGAAAEVGDGVPQATQHVIERQQRLLPERYHDSFLGRRQHRALGRLGAHWRIGRIVVVVRGCAISSPSSRSRRIGQQATGCSLETLGTRLEDTASCGRCREERLPANLPDEEPPGLKPTIVEALL